MARQKKCEGGAPEWLATYGDLVTLLLCFFVLLFSFSTIDAQKYKVLVQTFKTDKPFDKIGGDNIIGNTGDEGNYETSDELTIEESIMNYQKFNSMIEDIENIIEDQKLKKDISIIADKENQQVILRFDSQLLFDSGKADIKEHSKKYIKILFTKIPKEYKISIEGHTDNVPINNSEFPSNWELSTQRAVNVLKYIIEECKFPPQNLSAVGYGEYKPIAPNDTPSNKQKNRRVDIIIKK